MDSGAKKPWLKKQKQPGNNISSVARKYEVHPNQLFGWRPLTMKVLFKLYALKSPCASI